MFYVNLAAKKLYLNSKRSLFKVLFFSILFALIFSLLLFLSGTSAQMKGSMRTMLGDARLSARQGVRDISTVAKDLRERYADRFDDIQESYSAPVRIFSEGGLAASLCSGVQTDFSAYINDSVAWQGKAPEGFEEGWVYLEASVAANLSCVYGDTLTLQWSDAESGRMNTLQARLGGVFIGSGLIFSGASYVNLRDMRAWIMEDEAVNQLSLYFKSHDEDSMRALLTEINRAQRDRLEINSVSLDPSGGAFGIYKYYNLLVAFLLWMLVIVFFVILHFSNQNMFFTEYRGRKAELVTFLSYGMKVTELRKIVMWEAAFLFFFSLLGASILSALICLGAGALKVKDLRYADLITAIGGPRLAFALDARFMLITFGLMFFIMLSSAMSGANRYLGREIRAISGSAD